jgi:hypothetical protein
MAFDCSRELVQPLGRAAKLARTSQPIAIELEFTELADRGLSRLRPPAKGRGS